MISAFTSCTLAFGPRSGPRDLKGVGSIPLSATLLPNAKATYQMNQSTIIMPCNDSGYTDPASTVGWAVIDFDWSNGKSIWTKQRPMMDEIVLQNQVKMSTASSLGQTVWVYRGSMWAYPWYTSVRKTLEDPAYSDWYVKFKAKGPWYSGKCDAVNKTDCSELYHCQEQSPGYPTGDGDCGAPNCDCGDGVPCGFYVWNHSSTTVVHGQTFLEWFKDDYVFDYQGSSPLVSGMYFDDYWPETGGFPDPFPNMTQDMGLTAADQLQISKSYQANMAVIYAEMLKRGMFTWYACGCPLSLSLVPLAAHAHTSHALALSLFLSLSLSLSLSLPLFSGSKCGTDKGRRLIRTAAARAPS